MNESEVQSFVKSVAVQMRNMSKEIRDGFVKSLGIQATQIDAADKKAQEEKAAAKS